MIQTNIQIQWFPPSWVGIKSGNRVIYIDPAYLRTKFFHYPKRIEFSKWPDPIDGLPEEMEKADIILVTHHHKDHCKQVTVKRLIKSNTAVVAPKQCIRELGRDITVVEPGDEIAFDVIRVKARDAYNMRQGKSARVVHKKGTGVGYLVSLYGKSIYHAGDTDYIPEMKTLRAIDIALLPIGGRGFTMDMEEALKATIELRPNVVIPMHRFESDLQEFKKKVERRTNSVVAPLEVGEVYEIK